MSVFDRYACTKNEVEGICEACGRALDDVTLIAVSKTVDVDAVEDAVRAGARAFGENRPDELIRKSEHFPDLDWHFIGNIQSRRISDIVKHACMIHSLYERRHADKIDSVARDLGKVQDVLIEVNVSGEESKMGLKPEDALDMVRYCAALPNVCVRGLMTMAPQGDLDVAKKCFVDLVALHADIKDSLSADDAKVFDQISAGMSEDWRCAIEAGSTMVRVGRAIFSESF